MAWTNVKDECLPRVGRVARILGVSDREVLGTLTFLWRNSQDRMAVSGTRQDLVDWMHMEGEDAATIDRWFAALARAPFISEGSGGVFRIHGNDVEVARAEERHAIAQKGAKARWGKASKMPEACSEHAGSMPAATPIQGNARQCKEEEGEATSSPPPSEIQSSAVQTEADTAVLDRSASPFIAEMLFPYEPTGMEKPQDAAPPEPDEPLRLVGDPEMNDWLVTTMRCTRRGFDAWKHCPSQGGGDAVRLEAMLRAAKSKWENDERVRLKIQSHQTTTTGWLNTFLEIEAKKYTPSHAPPPGGADVLPLSARKAETAEEVALRAENERRKAADAAKQAEFDALPEDEKRLRARAAIRAGMAEHDRKRKAEA